MKGQSIKMSKLDSKGILQLCLESMEVHTLNPERDKYCNGFDIVFEKRKKEWLEMTGKEWRGE